MKKEMVLLPLGVLVFIFCVKDLEVVKNLTLKVKEVVSKESIEPDEGILMSAIIKTIKEMNPDGCENFTWIIDKQIITNKYTLERHGETIFCYHFYCAYHAEEMPEDPCGFKGSVQIVRRGNAWYSY